MMIMRGVFALIIDSRSHDPVGRGLPWALGPVLPFLIAATRSESHVGVDASKPGTIVSSMLQMLIPCFH